MGILRIKRKGIEYDVLFDDCDTDLVMLHTWNIAPNKAGCNYVVSGSGRGVPLKRLHRLILGVTDPKILVDHKNGDALDNRRNNIRIATTAQNCANKRQTKSRTGFKGVSISKHGTSFRAQIGRERIYLGMFPTAELAAEAYNKAAILYFGEFAYLNTVNNSLYCKPNVNPHFRVINSFDAIDSGNYGYCKGS